MIGELLCAAPVKRVSEAVVRDPVPDKDMVAFDGLVVCP
jgi:hypothetical protein